MNRWQVRLSKVYLFEVEAVHRFEAVSRAYAALGTQDVDEHYTEIALQLLGGKGGEPPLKGKYTHKSQPIVGNAFGQLDQALHQPIVVAR